MTTPTTMADWLQGFDEDYGDADGHDPSQDDYSELPDGDYEVQITGSGWRDYRNDDKEGFSGMGPIWRLRVCKGPHTGKAEEMLWWLIRLHPARGIHKPSLNTDAKRFYERDCHRLGLTPPQKISAIPGWTDPNGRTFLLRIKSKSKGDKTHRNLYVQKVLDGQAMRAQGFTDFRPEGLSSDGQWVELGAQSGAYGGGSQGYPDQGGQGYGDIPF